MPFLGRTSTEASDGVRAAFFIMSLFNTIMVIPATIFTYLRRNKFPLHGRHPALVVATGIMLSLISIERLLFEALGSDYSSVAVQMFWTVTTLMWLSVGLLYLIRALHLLMSYKIGILARKIDACLQADDMKPIPQLRHQILRARSYQSFKFLAALFTCIVLFKVLYCVVVVLAGVEYGSESFKLFYNFVSLPVITFGPIAIVCQMRKLFRDSFMIRFELRWIGWGMLVLWTNYIAMGFYLPVYVYGGIGNFLTLNLIATLQIYMPLWVSFRKAGDLLPPSESKELLDLKGVLACAHSRESFHLFLQKEFSHENLLFWHRVTQLMKDIEEGTVDDAKAKATAITIYDTFIDPDSASLCVNISSKTRVQLGIIVNGRRWDEESPLGVFVAAEREVFHLMERDSFPRFRLEYLSQEQESKTSVTGFALDVRTVHSKRGSGSDGGSTATTKSKGSPRYTAKTNPLDGNAHPRSSPLSDSSTRSISPLPDFFEPTLAV